MNVVGAAMFSIPFVKYPTHRVVSVVNIHAPTTESEGFRIPGSQLLRLIGHLTIPFLPESQLLACKIETKRCSVATIAESIDALVHAVIDVTHTNTSRLYSLRLTAIRISSVPGKRQFLLR